MPDFLNDTVQTLGDPLRNMMLALQGNQAAPPATPQGVSGALNQTLLRQTGDDPANDFMNSTASAAGQAGKVGSPMEWAMALAGGPRLGPVSKVPMSQHVPVTEDTVGILDASRDAVDRWNRMIPEPIRKAEMRRQGYVQDAYHGKYGSEFEGPEVGGYRGNFYSAKTPDLAALYARTTPHGDHYLGGDIVPFSGPNDPSIPSAQILPLKLNTNDYHVYDAQGRSWTTANHKAIEEAQRLGKPGVEVRNVLDEPYSQHPPVLGAPKDLFITFPNGGHTVRSAFARFDPRNIGKNNITGGLAGAAILSKALQGDKNE